MARFFFNLVAAGQLVRDEEGEELAREAVRARALGYVGDLLNTEIGRRLASSEMLIEVTDERDRTVLYVPFR